ncbi:hypothetical protein H6G04_33320 [Calothrix membranacea FACHB-236]|nr:hypothetical protein [Calothrix membranacea FACHB-236]
MAKITELLNIRLRPGEREIIQKVAAEQNMTISNAFRTFFGIPVSNVPARKKAST